MVECTDAHWPLVLTYADGDVQPEQAGIWTTFDAGCGQRAMAEGIRFVSVVGTGQRLSIDAATRKRFSTHLNARTAADTAARAAVHMVMRNAIVRGVVQALSWLSTNKSTDRIRAHDSLTSAIEGARRDLPDADIDWDAVESWFARLDLR